MLFGLKMSPTVRDGSSCVPRLGAKHSGTDVTLLSSVFAVIPEHVTSNASDSESSYRKSARLLDD